ncbi:ENR1 protein, partial [Edolisoma coerulescens]|nr:ENR1 protein [Edolisoma coerulescens]
QLFLCHAPGKNPYYSIPEISKFWENVTWNNKGYWKAPDGLFWICGERAYSKLPSWWRGRCTLGIVLPGFFLLPKSDGDELGISV